MFYIEFNQFAQSLGPPALQLLRIFDGLLIPQTVLLSSKQLSLGATKIRCRSPPLSDPLSYFKTRTKPAGRFLDPVAGRRPYRIPYRMLGHLCLDTYGSLRFSPNSACTKGFLLCSKQLSLRGAFWIFSRSSPLSNPLSNRPYRIPYRMLGHQCLDTYAWTHMLGH